jgi:hypothetical protein
MSINYTWTRRVHFFPFTLLSFNKTITVSNILNIYEYPIFPATPLTNDESIIDVCLFFSLFHL